MGIKIVLRDEGEYLNVLGDNQFIKVTGEETNGAYAVIEEVNQPGTGVPPHVHSREEETFFIIEGTVEFRSGDDTIVATPGTTVHTPRGVPHTWTVVGDTQARVLLTLCPAGGEKMFRELAQLPPGPPDMAKVLEICGRYGITFT